MTGPAMRAACLHARCSYLDVNADVDDFRRALACDELARATGVAMIPGVGYGVVFAECLAAHVTRRLPDATSLRLSLATETAGRSRGATLSVATALARGGLEVYGGELRKRSIAYATWHIGYPNGPATSFACATPSRGTAAHRRSEHRRASPRGRGLVRWPVRGEAS